MKSDLFPALEDITFAQKDPDAITAEVISRYELLTGRSLSRGDPVRLFLNAIILALVQQRNVIDHAAKMNLLAYSSGSYLDHIGALLGVTRLEASASTCNVKFSLSEAITTNITIPEGTRITPDGTAYFATTSDAIIAAGSTEVIVAARCTEAGEFSNGYVAGQINRLVDVFLYELEAVNVTTSEGGTDTETDEAFRERIQIAPESFTNAGSTKGYEYYARSADSDILSVSVLTPPDTEPGNVDIYVLMKGGILPDADTLAKVLAVVSADDIRPDTDYVHVYAPEVITFQTEATYWIRSADASQKEIIQAKVNQAVQDWALWQRSELGRDINPSKLTHDILDAGAVRCEIISPSYTVLNQRQVAMTNSIGLNFGGMV